MTKSLRLLAITVAVAGLMAGSIGSVSAGTSLRTDGYWNVYVPNNYDGSQGVVVTKQQSAPKGANQTQYDTCAKSDADTCVGTYTYVRAYAGAPWLKQ